MCICVNIFFYLCVHQHTVMVLCVCLHVNFCASSYVFPYSFCMTVSAISNIISIASVFMSLSDSDFANYMFKSPYMPYMSECVQYVCVSLGVYLLVKVHACVCSRVCVHIPLCV